MFEDDFICGEGKHLVNKCALSLFFPLFCFTVRAKYKGGSVLKFTLRCFQKLFGQLGQKEMFDKISEQNKDQGIIVKLIV